MRKLDRLIATGVQRRGKIFPDDDAKSSAFLKWFEPVFLKDMGHL